MVTFRRILKYTSTVVLGLLMLAWVVSLSKEYGGLAVCRSRCAHVVIARGTISIGIDNASRTSAEWIWAKQQVRGDYRVAAGRLNLICEHDHWHAKDRGFWGWTMNLPLMLLSTSILPFAIGPFISFRFRLWHYLAYTALVAVELAYYLRWQE
jgi:hypothetical protein